MKSFKFFAALLFIVSTNISSQETVFSRGEATTGNWWDGNNPWFRECDGWWIDRPDRSECDNHTTIGRNNIFIGHNNNTTMNVNGAWFQVRTLTLQGGATSDRLFNPVDNGAISLNVGIYNESTGNHIFNVPIGVDGNVEFATTNGPLSFTNDFFGNDQSMTFTGSHNILISGLMSGSGGGTITKSGSGTLTISNSVNSHDKRFQINEGIISVSSSRNLGEDPGGPYVNKLTFNGGTLQATETFTLHVNNLTTIDANNGTIDVPNVVHTLTYSPLISGTGGLTKAGAGTLKLLAANTYEGSTTIQAGTLELQGSLASSAITVRNGATLRISKGNSKNDVVEINALTVDPGGIVEIEADVNLTVNGTLTNNGYLTIKSDATSTGSLIHNTNNIPAKVERHIVAAPNWPENDDKEDDGTRGWHFLSSPVANQSISGDWTPEGAGNDYDFYAWAEGGTWLNQKADPESPAFEAFEPGKGYLVAYEQTGTRTFTGTLNNGDVTVALEHSGNNNKKDWTYQPGWNLLGNPYPSAIDWNVVDHGVSSPFQTAIAYIYDRSKGNGGNYELIDGNDPNAIIPAHQGFFVLANENPGDFTFTNDMRIHGDDFLKEQPVSEYIRLRITKDDFYSDTRIRIHKDAKHGTDRYDAHKLFSLNPNMPQVFTHTEDNTRVAINSIPYINEEQPISLGMRIPEDGEYTLTLQELSGAFGTSTLLLEDAHKDIFHDLHEQPVYAFEAEEGMISGRFTLHFSPPDEDDDTTDIPGADAQEARIWQHNNTLHVDNPDTDLYLHLYDINGRRLLNHHLAAGKHSIELNLPPGVYIIETSGKRHQETMKIIIQ